MASRRDGLLKDWYRLSDGRLQVVSVADRTSMVDRMVAEEAVQHSSNKIAQETVIPGEEEVVVQGIGASTTGLGTGTTSTSTVPIGTSTVPAKKDESRDVPMMGDGLEELAVLETLTDEDIDSSLDKWLGWFALTPHPPPQSASPHAMAVGPNQTQDRITPITDQDEGMCVEEKNRATGSGGQSPKIINVGESRPERLLAGLHLTPPDPSDPVGSLQRFFGELQGISDVAC